MAIWSCDSVCFCSVSFLRRNCLTFLSTPEPGLGGHGFKGQPVRKVAPRKKCIMMFQAWYLVERIGERGIVEDKDAFCRINVIRNVTHGPLKRVLKVRITCHLCLVPNLWYNFSLTQTFSLCVLQMIWAQQDPCSLNAKRAPVAVLYDSLIMAFPGAGLHCTIERRSGIEVTEPAPTSSGPHSWHPQSQWMGFSEPNSSVRCCFLHLVNSSLCFHNRHQKCDPQIE